jgi:hypothetical protein
LGRYFWNKESIDDRTVLSSNLGRIAEVKEIIPDNLYYGDEPGFNLASSGFKLSLVFLA